MRLKTMLTILAIFALAATGCEGGDDTAIEEPGTEDTPAEEAPTEEPGDEDSGAAAPVTVEMLDNEFEPAEIEVPAGEVEVALDNTGEAPHTFTIDDLGVDEEVAPGEQATVTFDAEPGTYDLICRFHEDLGMVGTVTVTE